MGYNNSKPEFYSDITSTVTTFWLSGTHVGKDLSETQQGIMVQIAKNKRVTIPELATSLKTTTRTIERNIERLKDLQKIKRVGGRKEGYWEVINE